MFDYLILGGGTAGCVLAARLSSLPDVRVLLIEAGEDFLPGREPEAIRNVFPKAHGDPRYTWPQLIAEVGADSGDGQPRLSRPFLQGRCIGGSSSIMGMMATRGLPTDYDEWSDLGAEGWGWSDVLPFFNRCERDLDFNGVLHGSGGPIPIRRNARESWPPFCRAFAESQPCRSFEFLPDFNGQFGDGISPAPMNNLPECRVSTAMAYLDALTRARPNLQILTCSTVETLLRRGRVVAGAMVRTAGVSRAWRARETIVCAGALHTPAILMRSGIGCGEKLRELGIEVAADLPGVGRNLQNHPGLGIAVDLPRHAWQSKALRTWSFAVLRFSSRYPGCPDGDMQIHPLNKTSWHPMGRRIGYIGVNVNKAFSRGEVSLAAADARIAPVIRMNLLADERDFERLVQGVRVALSILNDPAVIAVRNEAFLPPGGPANKLNRPSTLNWLKSLAILQVFGISGAVRRRILGAALVDPVELLSNPEALRELVRHNAAPSHHVCGTCRMGRADDRAAVVDSGLRVHGVQGLRVVDASIMPTIVSGNTHLPVIMIAEKAAEMMMRSRQSQS